MIKVEDGSNFIVCFGVLINGSAKVVANYQSIMMCGDILRFSNLNLDRMSKIVVGFHTLNPLTSPNSHFEVSWNLNPCICLCKGS